MTRTLRVVYWDIGPNPYMVERFNAVADRGHLNLEAWFSHHVEPGRRWEVSEADWRFAHRYLPALPRGDFRFVPPHWYLGENRPDLLVSLYGDATFALGWMTARTLRVSTAFWCQVTFDSWSSRRPWKEAAKRFMFQRVDATLGGGPDSRAYARRYGVRSRNALELRHAIDAHHYAAARSLPTAQRDAVRNDLDLRGVTFVFVGRLWSGKGLFDLVEAFARLQQLTQVETTLLLVGDGPDEDDLRRRCERAGLHVVFAGFRQKKEMPLIYGAADVFIFPTLGDPYGLVVDEAMAAGLPVISTNCAGEIELRIDEGVNGFIIPAHEPAILADRMKTLAEDAAMRTRMSLASGERGAERTPEQWAEDFEGRVADIVEGRFQTQASASGCDTEVEVQ